MIFNLFLISFSMLQDKDQQFHYFFFGALVWKHSLNFALLICFQVFDKSIISFVSAEFNVGSLERWRIDPELFQKY